VGEIEDIEEDFIDGVCGIDDFIILFDMGSDSFICSTFKNLFTHNIT